MHGIHSDGAYFRFKGDNNHFVTSKAVRAHEYSLIYNPRVDKTYICILQYCASACGGPDHCTVIILSRFPCCAREKEAALFRQQLRPRVCACNAHQSRTIKKCASIKGHHGNAPQSRLNNITTQERGVRYHRGANQTERACQRDLLEATPASIRSSMKQYSAGGTCRAIFTHQSHNATDRPSSHHTDMSASSSTDCRCCSQFPYHARYDCHHINTSHLIWCPLRQHASACTYSTA